MSGRRSAAQSRLQSLVDELDLIPFGFGAIIAVGFVLYTAYDTSAVADGINWAFASLGPRLAWLYLGSMFVLIAIGVYLLVGRYGSVRLGDGPPEYSYPSYLAMFFSAGLSAGIVFFGPSEALTHYEVIPPLFEGIESESQNAIVPAVAYTIFHYGISAWGGYLAIGIPVAYFAYRYDAPFRVSTALYPVLGEDRLNGVTARVVDTLAVVATIGGIATGLGFIATQLLDAITFETGRTFADWETVVAITGITALFTLSLVAGVSRGIRRLSRFNIGLMFVLLAVVTIAGPTAALLNTGASAIGTYIGRFFEMSLLTGAGGGDTWATTWTVFYWAWWIAWAPFVGLFLARISQGRTIRTVIGTAFITMTATSAVWFTAIGGSSVWLQHTGAVDIIAATSGDLGDGIAGFVLFNAMPLGELWQVLFFILVVTFFATSADSATLALGMLTTGGKRKPSQLNRLFWGIMMGLIAAILVVVGGAAALRSSVIVTGAPFAVICLVALVGFVSWIASDHPTALLNRSPDQQPRSSTELSED